MSKSIKTHPLHVKGKYYVDQEWCDICGSCIITAPNNFNLMESYDDNYGAYIYKQPTTLEEEERCKEAVYCCPTEAIHDDGEA